MGLFKGKIFNEIKQGLANFDSNVLQPVLNAAKPIAATIAETKFPGKGVGAAISSLQIGPDKTLVIKDDKTMTVVDEKGKTAILNGADKETLVRIGAETGVKPVKGEETNSLKKAWEKYKQWWKDQPILAGLATAGSVLLVGYLGYKGVMMLMKKGGKRKF